MKRQLVAALILLSARVLGAGDYSPATLILSQAVARLPDITAYLDVRAADDSSVPSLSSQKLAVTMAEQAVLVQDIQPFNATGEGLATVFLVNFSKSMKPEHFKQIHAALHDWRQRLRERDKLAIIDFGDAVRVVQPFSADQNSLKKAIDSLRIDSTQRALYQGIVQANQLIQQTADLPARRVIVALSDGLDNASGSVTRQNVLEQMETDRIPLYAIGFANSSPNEKKNAGLQDLAALAQASGGSYVAAKTRSPGIAYAEIEQHIRDVLRVRMLCPDCPADGQSRSLQVTLQDGGERSMRDASNIRLLPSSLSASPRQGSALADSRMWFVVTAIVGVIVLCAGLLIRHFRSKSVVAPVATSEFPGTWLRLTEVTGFQPGRVYEVLLNHTIVIGSTSTCQVYLSDDEEVSSSHCAISIQDHALNLHDFNPAHTIQVNGVPVMDTCSLHDDDLIMIGRTELRINWFVS